MKLSGVTVSIVAPSHCLHTSHLDACPADRKTFLSSARVKLLGDYARVARSRRWTRHYRNPTNKEASWQRQHRRVPLGRLKKKLCDCAPAICQSASCPPRPT